jgi:putative membrane protein
MSELNDPRVLRLRNVARLDPYQSYIDGFFGFIIERFGRFVHIFMPKESAALPRSLSLWTGSGLIVTGATVAVISVVQYRAVLRTLKPVEIPEGY